MISGDSLTGRDSELAAIRRALRGIGNYSGVVIAGAAGVGKTRLAREVLAQAAAAGERTNWIVGTESARALPLGAFTSSMGEMTDPWPSVRRVMHSFVSPDRRAKVLVGVDDAHLLDGLSAHVVHQLAQTKQARLVVTLRTGTEEPDAVTALWKDGLLARLDLDPLSAAATHDLIEGVLGGPVDARSARRYWKLTGGNAFFLRQLLKNQVAAGRMRQVAGVWMWDGDVAVSANLSDIVERQLGRLSPKVAVVIDALSQCEPLEADVLCDVVARRDLEVAERMHLVTVERTGGTKPSDPGTTLMARLAHPLFGELRRATAGEIYLSNLRGKLATRLAKDPDRDMNATVRRALLTLDSDLEPDPKLFLESAQYAMTLLDLDLADRFATAAAGCGVSEAATIRAMNMVLQGRGDRAEEFLRTICETGEGDTHQWSTVRAANLIWILSRPRDALAILDALAASEVSESQRAARLAIEACAHAVLAECERAADRASAALGFAELPDFHALMASFALVMALGALGRADELPRVAGEAFDHAALSHETSHLRFHFGGVYARACRLTGRIDECARSAKQLADAASDVPGLAYANLAFLLGHADLVRGHLTSAVKTLREVLAGVEKHSITTGLRPACCFALAEAHAKLGNAAQAEGVLVQAKRSVAPESAYMETNLALATGWTQVAGGELTRGVATVREAAEVARSRGQPTHELACLQTMIEWGDATAAARARRLAGELSLPLAEVVAAHGESLAAGDGEGLLATSEAYRSLGDRCAAADAAAQAAVAFAGGQQRKRSLYAGAIASQLAQECGGLCTPAMRSPVTPFPLTGRQREITELVAAGLSNREIAERLVTSVRTVEGHLYRACQRVGAKSRDDLATLMRSGTVELG